MNGVLLIDDDPHMRRVLRTVLAGHGHVVHEAATVAAGIAAFREQKPAIVLLALGLPDGDGLAVRRALRPAARAPVIVLSARGREGGKAPAEPSHTLRVHVAALRRKLERDPARPRWLVTEAGVGYRLRDPPG